MPTQDQTSPGFGANEWMVEEMRAAWSADPSSVSPQWRELFETDPSAGLRRPSLTPSNGFANGSASSAPGGPRRATITPQAAVLQRRSSAVQDVTRSDLPPAPPSDTAPPTSPYAQRLATHPAHDLEGDGCEDSSVRLKGAAARTAKNMDDSLSMPTATSARAIPAKVLIENRAVINSHLARTRGGKVSFTHLIGWAVVEALSEMPSMNVSYGVDEAGKPVLNEPAHVAFGLAIDVPGADGQRRLLVPSIKQADLMDLSRFVEAYEGLVAKARQNKLDLDDFRGTTVTLTNPGMIGTLHSVPRLMPGQGLIVGVGSMDYPAAFAGASPDTLARQGIGKVVTLTSTYDHRVIQGAASGEFLRLVERKLLGLDGFWSRAFESLRIPLEPVEWVRDTTYDPELETGKPARVAELIHAFRQRGHLAADTDPLTYRLRRHPDLDITSYGLSLWDLDRSFPTRGLGGRDRATLREILKMLHDAYCRTVGVEYMHIQDPAQRTWWQERLERDWEDIGDEERRRILTKLEQAEAFETFLQTKYVGQKRFSLEGGSPSSWPWTVCSTPPPTTASTRSSSAWPTAAGSTCSPTSPASPTARSSTSSRATASSREPEPGTSSTTWAPWASSPGPTACPPASPWPPTPPTWRRSTASSRGSCAPSRTASAWARRATRSCRSSSTATPPSQARAWSTRPST